MVVEIGSAELAYLALFCSVVNDVCADSGDVLSLLCATKLRRDTSVKAICFVQIVVSWFEVKSLVSG